MVNCPECSFPWHERPSRCHLMRCYYFVPSRRERRPASKCARGRAMRGCQSYAEKVFSPSGRLMQLRTYGLNFFWIGLLTLSIATSRDPNVQRPGGAVPGSHAMRGTGSLLRDVRHLRLRIAFRIQTATGSSPAEEAALDPAHLWQVPAAGGFGKKRFRVYSRSSTFSMGGPG